MNRYEISEKLFTKFRNFVFLQPSQNLTKNCSGSPQLWNQMSDMEKMNRLKDLQRRIFFEIKNKGKNLTICMLNSLVLKASMPPKMMFCIFLSLFFVFILWLTIFSFQSQISLCANAENLVNKIF